MSEGHRRGPCPGGQEPTAQGCEPALSKTRCLLLKRPENLTEKQRNRLAELLRDTRRSVRSDLLQEDFQFFWSSPSLSGAGRFLDHWYPRTMRSRLEPMKTVVRMLRGHRDLLLNGFRAKGQLSSGVGEGFTTKATLTPRQAVGCRLSHALEGALSQTRGPLPKPQLTHRFC